MLVFESAALHYNLLKLAYITTRVRCVKGTGRLVPVDWLARSDSGRMPDFRWQLCQTIPSCGHHRPAEAFAVCPSQRVPEMRIL